MPQLRSGFKYHLWLPVAVGVMFVGLPYSISLAAQLMLGWPSKPGYKKYLEAVKPRRIYCITRAVLESLKCLQYGRLYLQLKSWYDNDKNRMHYEKGIAFGRRGNKLDLYHPPGLAKSGDMAAPLPLVIFVYGGAWSSGERYVYCLLARHLTEELNATVVCPDYTTYPKMNVLGMVQDIADCLIWAQESGPQFNFDKDNIVLIGHSAGAHLCALTTLFLIDAREELFIEASKQQDLASMIKGVIGLSGVYNIMEHYEYEQKRGVEYVSAMHKAMNGVENFPYYSPTHWLETFDQDKLSRVPPFTLIHGTSDVMVPAEASAKFSERLTSLSVKASLYVLSEVDHVEMITDLMAAERRFYHAIYSCIKHEYRKLVDIS
ncbi:uncharacterized protein si:dkey-193c22.1 isoform X1 [Phyllopteryx taeniolatus]|uniref:uncharacterized protein si:dkey-193c22.1 isoform X1 n=1 Tax=Phyllopteryx taeniolatus TaxID=161469 RepID=UPI002AD4D8D5|nr:uncharacterized protein si:dkey-193c22.1 isoform X1 [Phyllopteryx taeniolatus]